MVITLINPSPSRGKKFHIHSAKGKPMARRMSSHQKLSASFKRASKKSGSQVKRSLTMWSRYPWGIAPKKGKKSMARKAKSRKKARRIVPLFVKRSNKLRRGAHRPVVIWTGKRWRRPLKSRAFPRPTRINPRRSFRRYRRNPLSLPKLPFGIDKTVMTALPVAGGLALGMFAMPQIAKIIPASMQKYNKFFGVAHIAIGVAAMVAVKKDVVKTLGGTLVAMGLYDLLASNVPQLNLPALPRGAATQAGADEIVGASFETVGTDFTPAGALGSSYGTSYEGDDLDYGGDSIEIG